MLLISEQLSENCNKATKKSICADLYDNHVCCMLGFKRTYKGSWGNADDVIRAALWVRVKETPLVNKSVYHPWKVLKGAEILTVKMEQRNKNTNMT